MTPIFFPDTGVGGAGFGPASPSVRGLPKVRLQHAFTAVALNLIGLDAWWNGHPLDRTRTSHLSRLDYTLAA